MLDLAKHIVNQKSGDFEPQKFEDHYEEALSELINQKRAGKTISPKPRPKGENVVDLMDALKKSLNSDQAAPRFAAKSKRPRKVSAGQKEMLLPIGGKPRRQDRIQESSQASRREGQEAGLRLLGHRYGRR